MTGICCRCYDEEVDVFPANCAEKPDELLGAPLGQYHCPDCGAMVMAGLPHPDLCQPCIDRKHPYLDKPSGNGVEMNSTTSDNLPMK